MWLMTRDGFCSIAWIKEKNLLALRARDRVVLERFATSYTLRDPSEITTGDGSDYPHRLYITKDELRSALSRIVDEIEYGRFKPELRRARGQHYYDVALRCWSVLLDLADRTAPRRGVASPRKTKRGRGRGRDG